MDSSFKHEVTVGLVVIVAIVAFVWGSNWLMGRSVFSHSDDWWTIRFADAGNLKRSSAVRVSGVPVGKVERIDLARVGQVDVRVSLNKSVRPKSDASAELVAIGFVGDVAIELSPGRVEPVLTPEGTAEHPIPGAMAKGLTDLASSLGKRADTVLQGLQAIANQKTADQITATMTALQATLKSAQRTMEIYGDADRGPTAQLRSTLAALEQTSSRLDSTLANPGLVRALDRSDSLTANLTAMTAQLGSTSARLDTLLLRVNQGQGTIGKFATDTGFYTDIRALSQSMKRLVDELQKHPGKVPVTVKIF